MPLNMAAFRESIFDWASSESGLRTIWERPNEARPRLPYVSLNILTGPVVQGGQQETRFSVADDEFSVNALITFTISVRAYGDRVDDDPLQVLTNLQLSLGKNEVLESFREDVIAIWDEGDVENIPELLETGFEERANMDVLFAASHSVLTDPGQIEKVALSGEVEGSVGTIIIPEEVINA